MILESRSEMFTIWISSLNLLIQYADRHEY